jgi:hypothetical protein
MILFVPIIEGVRFLAEYRIPIEAEEARADFGKQVK